MIRRYQPADLPYVLDIWLNSNKEAHSFISATYWDGNLEYMKQVLPQAELYVFEIENHVVAFVGLEKDYIAGIFIKQEYRSQGIGKQLLDFLKKRHLSLSLSVYDKNKKALRFYVREGFHILKEGLDTANNEKEFLMRWENEFHIITGSSKG